MLLRDAQKIPYSQEGARQQHEQHAADHESYDQALAMTFASDSRGIDLAGNLLISGHAPHPTRVSLCGENVMISTRICKEGLLEAPRHLRGGQSIVQFVGLGFGKYSPVPAQR